MTEPLNITLDRLSEEYYELKKRCESAIVPSVNDNRRLKSLVDHIRNLGVDVTAMIRVVNRQNASENSRGHMDIKNVMYRGRICDVIVTEQPIATGQCRMDEEVRLYPQGIIGDFGVPDTEIVMQTAKALYKSIYARNADPRTKDIAYRFGRIFKDGWGTSTVISGESVVHQQGTAQELAIKVDMYGLVDGMLSEQTCADELSMAISGMEFEEFNRIINSFGDNVKRKDITTNYLRKRLWNKERTYLSLRSGFVSFYGSDEEYNTPQIATAEHVRNIYGFKVIPRDDA